MDMVSERRIALSDNSLAALVQRGLGQRTRRVALLPGSGTRIARAGSADQDSEDHPPSTNPQPAEATTAAGATRANPLTTHPAYIVDDDGTVLKEWFTDGQLLDSRRKPWVHAHGGVRLDELTDGMSVLMAKAGSAALGKASVHARLPGPEAWAGFAFDVVGPHDYSVAGLWRGRADAHPQRLLGREA